MATITVTVDEEVFARVQRVATGASTTVTQMVQEFLASIVERDEADRNRAATLLGESFRRLSRDMGERSWTREDLHRRPKRPDRVEQPLA